MQCHDMSRSVACLCDLVLTERTLNPSTIPRRYRRVPLTEYRLGVEGLVVVERSIAIIIASSGNIATDKRMVMTR
jgi:hypothetical protein